MLARIFGISEEIYLDSDGAIMEGEDLLEEMFEDDWNECVYGKLDKKLGFQEETTLRFDYSVVWYETSAAVQYMHT